MRRKKQKKKKKRRHGMYEGDNAFSLGERESQSNQKAWLN